MNIDRQSTGTTRRRNVELTWVPGHDIFGRPIMEMRWVVEDCPPVVATA